jgi:hypothetical protein
MALFCQNTLGSGTGGGVAIAPAVVPAVALSVVSTRETERVLGHSTEAATYRLRARLTVLELEAQSNASLFCICKAEFGVSAANDDCTGGVL